MKNLRAVVRIAMLLTALVALSAVASAWKVGDTVPDSCIWDPIYRDYICVV